MAKPKKDFEELKREGLKTIRSERALRELQDSEIEDLFLQQQDKIKAERYRLLGDKAFEHRYVRRPLLTDDDKHEY